VPVLSEVRDDWIGLFVNTFQGFGPGAANL
jgi:hypothetical protein